MTEQDWRDALAARYPSLYREYKGDPRRTCMAWGIAVGDGWRELVENLSADIVAIDTKNKVVVDQVKQKLGGLRFYVHIEMSEKRYALLRWWFFKKMWFRAKVTTKFVDWRTLNKIDDLRRKLLPTFSDKVRAVINAAEIKSYTICEGCGKPGKRRGSCWVRVLCDDCGVGKTR